MGGSEGAGAVGELVFFGTGHFGKGPGVALGNEEGVVAEAVGPPGGGGHGSFDPAFDGEDGGAESGEGEDAAETGGASGGVL